MIMTYLDMLEAIYDAENRAYELASNRAYQAYIDCINEERRVDFIVELCATPTFLKWMG